jgi:3-deoxy-D-manno-octulosonic-acid transferase
VLPLIERLLQQDENLHVLLTSGTVTSARIMADRLPARAVHQYVPVDQPASVGRFLDHWQPDLALWVESELWPNLIHQTRERGVAMALINARMSESSFRRWRRLPFLARPLLQSFQFCMAQSAPDAGRLATLGAHNVSFLGNLKAASPPLSADPRELHAVKVMFGRRPRWLAASTHPGEEVMIAKVHRQLVMRFPNLLTIIVPRHANRGDDIAVDLANMGLSTARRSLGQAVGDDTAIYLGDSMGEMGLYYRLANIVLMGGSLVEHGGQNPLEAARLDAALLFGRHMFNFTDQATAMINSGGAREIANQDDLVDQVALLLSDGVEVDRRAKAAATAADDGDDVLAAILQQLAPLLPSQSPEQRQHQRLDIDRAGA